ncbi:TetR/AcrR family transcriptional regulator [Treponema sp. R80B11-R83G3]
MFYLLLLNTMPRTKKTIDDMSETARQKIKAAALSLFARKGLSVTVDEIAKKAALSKEIISAHYPSKEEMIAELIQQAVVISGKSLKEIAGRDSSAAVKIKQITAMMCEMLSNNNIGIDYFMFIIQVSMSDYKMPDTDLFTADMPNPIETLTRIIYQGQAEGSAVTGDPMQLASVYWAAIQGLCCYAITGIPLSPDPEILSRIILKD